MRVIIEVVVFCALITVSTARVFSLYLHCHYSSSSSWQLGACPGETSQEELNKEEERTQVREESATTRVHSW